MKHLKTLLAALALTCAGGAWAQTDVTSTYLTNADFTADTPIDNHLCGYGKDMSKNGTSYYGVQAVTGWTTEILSGDNSDTNYPNSGIGGAVFAYGSTWEMRGNNKTAPATDPDGNAGQCFGFFAVWGCGFYIYQDVTFPAGEYTINVPMYSQSGAQANDSYVGFLSDAVNKTIVVNPTEGQWVNGTVSFTLTETTEGKIAVGYKSKGSGSGANPHLFVDKVQILYKATVVKDVLEAAIADATALNARLEDETLAAAIATAQGVYDSSSASQEDINVQAATLTAAMSTAVVSAITTSADGNITNVLLANPGFENSAAETINWPTSGSANSVDYASTDWKLANSAAWSSSAVVAYGGEGQVNGVKAPEADNAGNGGNTLGISVGWDGIITYRSTAYKFPAGYYTMTANAYNNLTDVTQFRSKVGFVPTSGDATLSKKEAFTYGAWETDVVSLKLTEEGEYAIQIGGQAISGGSGSNAKVFFDNITVTYMSLAAGAKPELLAEITTAEGIYNAKANVGTGLFYITEAAWTKLAADIEAAQAVYDNASATYEEVVKAIEDIKAAVETYKATIVLPDADKVYAVKNATEGADLYLGLNKGKVTLVANKQALKFEATEGGYYLTDGEQYVGYAGSGNNNWSMTAAADKKDVLSFALVDGKYTIKMASSNLIGTDDYEDGKYCFANKAASNNGYWTIEEVEAAAETALNEDETYAAAGIYANVTLNRTINAGWNAVVLPFAVDAADFEGAIFATYAGDETVDDVLKLKFNSVSTVAANTPFLFYAPAAMTSFTFEGILVNTQHDAAGTAFDFVGFYGADKSPIVAGDYILTGGNVQKAKGGNTIKAYRAYFKANGTASAKAAQFVVDGDVVTGINAAALVSNESNAAVYNLNGVRVSGNLQKGVYIQNGKKVVVK